MRWNYTDYMYFCNNSGFIHNFNFLGSTIINKAILCDMSRNEQLQTNDDTVQHYVKIWEYSYTILFTST